MTKKLKWQNKKMVCIDDSASNENVKAFIYSYQSFSRDDYKV